MPNIKATKNEIGQHVISRIDTGEEIGRMVLVNKVYWINGIPYSHSFLESLAEFEDDTFNPPEPLSTVETFFMGCAILAACISILAAIVVYYV